jgi:hypothetical protein
VLETFFDEEPIYIPVSSDAGGGGIGVDAAMDAILVALRPAPAGRRRCHAATQGRAAGGTRPRTERPEVPGERRQVRRASARARLVYEPATVGQREVGCAQSWRLVAPTGPIEAEELRWYLEKYAVWPSHYFQERARRRSRSNLVDLGPAACTRRRFRPTIGRAACMQAWAQVGDGCGAALSRCTGRHHELDAGTPEADVAQPPAKPRRCCSACRGSCCTTVAASCSRAGGRCGCGGACRNTHAVEPPVLATPIRILLVSPRPEDDACGYIDHRASSLPLVRAMEQLGEVVHLTLLATPTLSALREELQRAKAAGQPYHVLHFDGHGTYNRQVGLGGLCFEHDEDGEQIDKRRHRTVYTDTLGPLLRDHGIRAGVPGSLPERAGRAGE